MSNSSNFHDTATSVPKILSTIDCIQPNWHYPYQGPERIARNQTVVGLNQRTKVDVLPNTLQHTLGLVLNLWEPLGSSTLCEESCTNGPINLRVPNLGIEVMDIIHLI